MLLRIYISYMLLRMYVYLWKNTDLLVFVVRRTSHNPFAFSEGRLQSAGEVPAGNRILNDTQNLATHIAFLLLWFTLHELSALDCIINVYVYDILQCSCG